VTWSPVPNLLVGINCEILYLFDDFEVLWIENWYWN